ncbi:class I SAM-dependent methyltransferase [Ravibacter arvi]|uniref:Class I SAM-dependent methyltransferase n=1 Tax=Ravibacter arvi TaxID=2051041 RepID=A0ABP8LLD2_9BACT
MIHNEAEYLRMYELERRLWWYSILHKKVLNSINRNFAGPVTGLKILDAACGTGGLLMFLKEQGFQNLTGFDYSAHAVNFSRKRGLDVGTGDLRKVSEFKSGDKFDLICCNDALYFLTEAEITGCLRAFSERLTPNGLVLVNLNAFGAFSGSHDVAVGSNKRFTVAEFRKITAPSGLKMTYYTYWPFLLSLPIWLVRSWQRFRMNTGANGTEIPVSDVRYPGDLPNKICYLVTKSEELLPAPLPFGSSLFMALRK